MAQLVSTELITELDILASCPQDPCQPATLPVPINTRLRESHEVGAEGLFTTQLTGKHNLITRKTAFMRIILKSSSSLKKSTKKPKPRVPSDFSVVGGGPCRVLLFDPLQLPGYVNVSPHSGCLSRRPPYVTPSVGCRSLWKET